MFLPQEKAIWRIRMVSVLCLALSLFWASATQAGSVDLSKAALVISTVTPRAEKTAAMVQEEIAKRTGISLSKTTGAPPQTGAAIILSVGAPASATGPAVPDTPESYSLWVDKSGTAPRVYLAGRDERGVLFAAGRLLRSLRMRQGSITLDDSLRIATSPKYPIRGHQIGYRNTANAYDAWDVEQYEQYMRDMAVFGANTIELIPAKDRQEKDSPHMKRTMWDMTAAISKVMDEYDLDVWLWVALEADVSKPDIAGAEVEVWRKLFESCPRLDGVFVPGGDPGHTEPPVLMPFLERIGAMLREVHPEAGVWVSNQGFTPKQNDEFFGYLQEKMPDTITGVVFGPWVKITIKEMRERTPAKYPIRRYPDITHCLRCQYPQPEWDPAFAHTLGREPYNPRPLDQRQIHNMFAPYADGFISYSDGINDDVNKVIWSVLGWDPDYDVQAILDEYGRYFIGGASGEAVGEGLMAFERNWRGALLTNDSVAKTFAHWQAIEEANRDALDTNWRLQLALLRAYYDEYVRRRLVHETRLEKNAVAALSKATPENIEDAIATARQILAQAGTSPDTKELRKRLVDLGAALFKSIGMQLDVANYQAANPERGAVLEFLDEPLNNRRWIEAECDAILVSNLSAAERLARIQTILNWEDPGPGGFYDDLGNARKEPHLIRQKPWEEDPGYVSSTQDEFSRGNPDWRLSWRDQAQTLFGTPLQMRYTGLSPNAAYKLRVIYTGRFKPTMTLIADGQHEVHGPLPQPSEPKPLEFDIPKAATADGTLNLEWQLVDGRGCQVAEVWLIRK